LSSFVRARADDVRALAGAIVLGSGAGLLVGGAFLATGSPAKPPAPALLTPTSTVQASAAKASTPQSVKPGPGLLASLRGRLRLDDPTHAVARPFQFPVVAKAKTDLQCLTEAVYFEARGEEKAGQQAVAQVVLNRVRHPAFPKTICGVVHQRTASSCQFSFACSVRQDGAMDNPAWRRAQAVAQAALHGSVMATVGDATHFQSARANAFSGLLKVAQIGAHIFYRFGGHAGASDMFHQTPTPSPAAPKVELAKATVPPTKPALAAKPELAKTAEPKVELTKLDASKPVPGAAAKLGDKPAMVATTSSAVHPPAVMVRLTTSAADGKPLASAAARSAGQPATGPAITAPGPLPAPAKPTAVTIALAQG
jgi:hypothetical protein